MDNKKNPRFFYGWTIVAVALIAKFIAQGLRSSFSLFYIALRGEFGWSGAATAVIVSTLAVVSSGSAPLSGALADRFGPRKVIPAGSILAALGMAACSQASAIWHFCLLFGVVAALGMSLSLNPLFTVIANWFVKRRGAALGISQVGSAACQLLAILTQYLISAFGWRWAFVILGALQLVIVLPLAALFLRRKPQDMGLLPDGATTLVAEKSTGGGGEDILVVDKKWAATRWTVPKAIRTRQFWMIFLAHFFFWGIAAQIMHTYEIPFLVGVGYSVMFAASIFGLTGVIDGVGSAFGFISDRIGREITATLGLTGAILGVLVLILITDTSHTWMLYAFTVVFGLSGGLFRPLQVASTADLFQGENFGAINGFAFWGIAIGGAIGPWLGGYIYDVTGTYIPAFVIAIIAIFAALVCIWVAAPRKVRLVAGKAPKRSR